MESVRTMPRVHATVAEPATSRVPDPLAASALLKLTFARSEPDALVKVMRNTVASPGLIDERFDGATPTVTENAGKDADHAVAAAKPEAPASARMRSSVLRRAASLPLTETSKHDGRDPMILPLSAFSARIFQK